MFEGFTPSDDFGETGEFDPVYERMAPSTRIPIGTSGGDMVLTPANTTVRMFFGGDREQYNRVIVHLDDGTKAPFQPDADFMRYLVHQGYPVELPDQLDETDIEFMDDFMRYWTEAATSELDQH